MWWDWRSTVQSILNAAGVGRLDRGDRATTAPGPVRRYQRERPGELVHVDVKKLAGIREGGGWRILGRSAATTHTGSGYRYLHRRRRPHPSRLLRDPRRRESGDRCRLNGGRREVTATRRTPQVWPDSSAPAARRRCPEVPERGSGPGCSAPQRRAAKRARPGHSDHEHPLATVSVPERSAQQEQAGQGQQVAGAHPPEIGHSHVELTTDGRSAIPTIMPSRAVTLDPSTVAAITHLPVPLE